MAEFVELQVESGSTFSIDITVNDSNGTVKNLTNYTARSQMRKSYYSTTAYDFVVNITNPSSGIISMSMTAANTANVRSGRYLYDVEIQDNAGVVTRIFEGIVNVSPNITR